MRTLMVSTLLWAACACAQPTWKEFAIGPPTGKNTRTTREGLQGAGVPFVRIDCGFTKDYHQPTDTPDKVDYALLTRQVKLVFLTLWNMANE